MTPEQDERLVRSFESIAEAFDFMAGSVEKISETLQRNHEKTFPEKIPPKPATITHVKTEEELLREAQGGTGEPIDEWQLLGPREKEWLDKHPGERDFYTNGPSVEGKTED